MNDYILSHLKKKIKLGRLSKQKFLYRYGQQHISANQIATVIKNTNLEIKIIR